MADEWDLGEVLAERKQPSTEVTIYLSEELSYAKAELMSNADKVKDSDLERFNERIAEIDQALEEAKYIVHLTGIPSRMRDDISSKALSQKPYKLDWTGRDDALNQIEREKIESTLVWHAQISSVDNPHGNSKNSWTIEQITQFHEALPHAARNAVSEAIAELAEKSEQYSVKAKNIDF